MMKDDIFKHANHNPPQLFLPDTMYMLTASIYPSERLLFSSQRKSDWVGAFYKAAGIYKWMIVAWVVLENHYHAIVQSPKRCSDLVKICEQLS